MRINESRWIQLAVLTLAALGMGIVSSPVGAEKPDTATTAAAASRGRADYVNYCGSCHGKSGQGDGPVAEYLEPKPADLTRITARYDGTFPSKTIHQIIDGRERRPAHGSLDMPAWGNAFTVVLEDADEDNIARKIDDLVAYLQSIQAED